jgi:hypothetical protein
MRLGQTFRSLHAPSQDTLEGERSAVLAQNVTERSSGQILGHEIQFTVDFVVLVERNDVRMTEFRYGARFPFESKSVCLIAGEVTGQLLDRDLMPESDIFGEVDLTHPPLTETAADPIMGHGLVDQ